jgi:NitT/TauT family transport system substrate-binding protein
MRPMLRFLLTAIVVFAGATSAAAADRIRLAVQKTGTLAWELDVIKTHGLDRKLDLVIEPIELASTEAGKIALKGGSADLMLSDWLWVARERSLGDGLVFYPSSSTLGAVMVPAQSAIREFVDLKGKKLAIAGGPLDKSWLLLQALARRAGIDLRKQAKVVYGAPPLLTEKALQGENDATLTFWNFCAELESRGHKRVIAMADVMRGLGAKGPVAIVGYTFDGTWAARNRSAVDRFPKRPVRPRTFWHRRNPNGSGLRRGSASPTRMRSRSTASAMAKASCGVRSPRRRPMRRHFTLCSPRSAAPSWSGRRASSRPEPSIAPQRGSEFGREAHLPRSAHRSLVRRLAAGRRSPASRPPGGGARHRG